MALERIAISEEGPYNVEVYVAVENPFLRCHDDFEAGRLFRAVFVEPWEEKFASGGHQQAEDWYENCIFRLAVHRKHPNIIKINDNYFTFDLDDSMQAPDRKEILYVEALERIDFGKYDPIAVRRLRQMVLDHDLSRAEEALIRGIAIETFHQLLEFAATYPSGRDYTLNMILHAPQRNHAALNQLESLGFNFSKKYA